MARDNREAKPGEFTYKGDSGRTSIYVTSNGVDFLPQMVRPDNEFRENLEALVVALDYDEIHLTGGEPTLHPDVAELVGIGSELGLKVGLTSNGEKGSGILDASCEAGLDRINFSIFGTTAQELAMVQDDKYQDPAKAQEKIDALKASVETAKRLGLKASANIVIPDYSHKARVLRLLEEYPQDLNVRLLNSLDDHESMEAIYTILGELGATPTKRKVIAGASGARTAFDLADGREVIFKQPKNSSFVRVVRYDDIRTRL